MYHLSYSELAVVYQEFNVNVDTENYVIKGNDAILKCKIPSFVTDLLDIISWVDNLEKEYFQQTSNGNSS